MSKSVPPGHLIAALLLLGLVVPTFGTPPLLMVPGLLYALGLPMLMAATGLLVVTGLWVWCVVLVIGLLTRQPWAARGTRITAGLLCAGGSLVLVAGLGPGLVSDLDLFAYLVLDFAVVPLGLGGYLLWALGRADVRAWLEPGPAAGA